MNRILHIVGSMDRAGAETMIMNLYRVLDKTKFQFDFLYFTDKKCDYDLEIQNLGGKIFRIQAGNPFKRMKLTITLLKNHPEWQTVHCHTLFSNAFHIYAAYRANIPQRISHSHSSNYLKNRNKLGQNIYQFISRKIQKQYATHYLACGHAAASFLFPDINNVIILPNAIDITQFSSIAKNSSKFLKHEFKLSEKTLILTQIGRLNIIKNHGFSIQIAERLKKKNIPFRLFFVGQGLLEKDLKLLVRKSNLINEVIFLGLRKDISQILGSTDLLLMPSLYEGFPVVLVESQSSGTPALISDKISKEVDLDLGLIKFISIENPEEWVNAILQTPSIPTNNQQRCSVMKEKGYDIYQNIQTLEKIYTHNH